MERLKRRIARMMGRRSGSLNLSRRAAQIRVDPVEPPSGATVRLGDDATYDVAMEYHFFGEEQGRKWEADGMAASCRDRARAAELGPAADGVRAVLDVASERARRTGEDRDHAEHHLTPYVRRTAFAHRRYQVVFWLLGFGDTAGVLGAAILMGEQPIIAAGQAIASGVAAVTAGLVGGDVRELKLARARARMFEDELPPELERYRRLFVPVEAEPDTYRLALRLAVCIVGVLGIAIFALRSVVEGPLGGLTFGALGLATAAASFLNSWIDGDDVADLLAIYASQAKDAAEQVQALSGSGVLAGQASATETAERIEAEHEVRGLADKAHVQALKYEVYRNNTSVFGHGVYRDSDGRREFHNGAPVSEMGFHKLVPTPIRRARIGRRAARPAARNVCGQDGGDAAQ